MAKVLMIMVVLGISVLECFAHDTHPPVPAGSCMEDLLLRSGIPLEKVVPYEKTLASLDFDVDRIEKVDEKLLAFILGHSTDHAGALQACIRGTLAFCKDYRPCSANGRCVLSAASARYSCVCDEGKTGSSCQMDDATVRLNNSLRAVKAAALTTSKKVALLAGEVDQLQEAAEACNQAVLGYSYTTKHHQYIDNNDHAQLASLNYVKKSASSLLRVSYTANIRVFGGPPSGKAARWFVKIDGEECASPNKIDIFYYRTDTENVHIPSVLQGICSGTGPQPSLAAGQHTITIHVGDSPDHVLGGTSNGYGSLALLEVQEICPPY